MARSNRTRNSRTEINYCANQLQSTAPLRLSSRPFPSLLFPFLTEIRRRKYEKKKKIIRVASRRKEIWIIMEKFYLKNSYNDLYISNPSFTCLKLDTKFKFVSFTTFFLFFLSVVIIGFPISFPPLWQRLSSPESSYKFINHSVTLFSPLPVWDPS